jgi:CTP-dependent riboflavin kinase
MLGTIKSGAKYDSTHRNWKQFKLGYTPFKGTLNVRLHQDISEKDFHNAGEVRRAFPDFMCIKGTLNNEIVDLCYSKHKRQKDISDLFVISDKALRETLGLKDTEDVEIQLGGF